MSVSTKVIEIGSDEFDAEVLRSDRPVILDVYSTECPPCEALAPKFDALAELYGDDIKFVKLFRQGHRALAETLNVRSSPTLLFFNHGREVAARLNGGIKRSAIGKTLDGLLSPARADAIRGMQQTRSTEADLLILGGGPAGITAGIYAAQAKLRTILVDAALGGGNLAITHQISNYPGFPKAQPGYMLAHYLVEHAKAAGVDLRLAAEVARVDLANRSLVIDGVETISAKKLLIATGTSPRPVGIKGELQYKGKGVSYCATCDAKYFDDKDVIVIGGGNSALEESLFIAKFARKVTILLRGTELRANKSVQEQVLAHPRIELLMEHGAREFLHDGKTVRTVIAEDKRRGSLTHLACDGVFIFAGLRPNLELFEGRFDVDSSGYVKVDEDMRTSVPSVFAAGDIVSKKVRQMTTAIADGTIASVAIAKELAA